MKKEGFSSSRYKRLQTSAIVERIRKFGKLYLEIGGKLSYDYHASRVLHGFNPSLKIEILKDLKKKLKNIEIIYRINAEDIEKKKELQDSGLTFDKQAIKDIKNIESFGLKVNHVVITRFTNQYSVLEFKRVLHKLGIHIHVHREIKDYLKSPDDAIKGISKQSYIHTNSNLIVVTGAAGGSGKMAVALSQIYHETKRGLKTGFAKYELFPIWNLPITHEVNIAYEAATADLQDKIMMDKMHKSKYKKEAVNYNRDIKNFAILKKILPKIPYHSPTDMGINMAKFAITNDKICREAALHEISQRYLRYAKEYDRGIQPLSTLSRMREVMKKAKLL